MTNPIYTKENYSQLSGTLKLSKSKRCSFERTQLTLNPTQLDLAQKIILGSKTTEFSNLRPKEQKKWTALAEQLKDKIKSDEKAIKPVEVEAALRTSGILNRPTTKHLSPQTITEGPIGPEETAEDQKKGQFSMRKVFSRILSPILFSRQETPSPASPTQFEETRQETVSPIPNQEETKVIKNLLSDVLKNFSLVKKRADRGHSVSQLATDLKNTLRQIISESGSPLYRRRKTNFIDRIRSDKTGLVTLSCK